MSISIIVAALVAAAPGDPGASAPDFSSRVAPIFRKYCAGCHNDEDREGKFSLESFAALQKGTAHGPAILPGDSAGSLIVRLMTAAKKPVMPPEDEPRPGPDEVATIRAWIDAGARGPQGLEPDRLTLHVPKIPSHARARPISAMDASPDGQWLAVARGTEVALFRKGTPRTGSPTKTLGSFPGEVTAIHFVDGGRRLVTASGIAGLGGVAAIWEVDSGAIVRRFEGHRDLLYDAELSPDGHSLATCGYDKKIEIWEADSGKLLRTLEGHTGAVYDVGFSPDGRFLVSASADDTCKVWRVADGLRLDTLPQPLKAEYACAFSPDGRTIVAGGADNNIRVWRFISREKPEINPMEIARFAHEGAIVRLAFTPDGSKLVTLAEDRTIKTWRTSDYRELRLWADQPDVAVAMAMAPDGRSFEVGRLDGSMACYGIPADLAAEASPRPSQKGSSAAKTIAEAGPIREGREQEPNDSSDRANRLELPARVAGTIDGGKPGHPDTDLFRFEARAGQQWVFEVDASRSKSRLDSFLEILNDRGDPVPRVVLQAVRDSYFTFRGKDADAPTDFRLFNWQEMSLDDYLYANGEVVRLWLYPRGPDSGFVVYPGRGERWGYFDTTPLAHALGEPCYIVRPHPPGTRLVPNGLPVFTLPYENDDDAHRELGKDSRLFFQAPADGAYLVRIRDVRGLQGADFGYKLTVRPRHPDFEVKLTGANPAVGAGGAKEFRVTAQRIDGFDGPIQVEIRDVPAGFRVTTPIVIQEGQLDAFGVIEAEPGAAAPSAESASGTTVRAMASVDGREVTHEVNGLGTIRLAPAPRLGITIGPADGGPRPISPPGLGPLEFAIEPGQTIAMTVKLDRRGFRGPVSFGNEGSGRNLPFGVIIDNLGLNGLLVMEDQQERTFFVTADPATPPQRRAFHLTTSVDGGQSTRPVLLHVRARETTLPAGLTHQNPR